MSEPVTLIRFSPTDNLIDRLNKAMVHLKGMMDGLQAQIDELKALKASTSAPGYPGIENNSAAIIQGPVPGGPSPIPPFLTPHSVIIGEGSTPTKQITGTDGQVIIACSNGDPAFANLTGDGTINSSPTLIAFQNACNSITVGINQSFWTWIVAVSLATGVSQPS